MSGGPTGASLDGPAAIFQSYLEQGTLRLQRCDDCARPVFPPRIFCPNCSGRSLSWADGLGCGEVYSATTIPNRDGSSRTITLVDLDDGVRIMASAAHGWTPQIGARVATRVSSLDGASAVIVVPEEQR